MKKLIPTHTTAAHTTNPYLGYSRQECRQLLANSNIESIAFGHWLAIPSQQLLDLLHKSLLALDTPLTKVNKTVLLQEVYYWSLNTNAA
ncbi:hypothetical protein [Psychrobacter sp. Ps3]|uniref:hypothetical protein n=1 Tax=Psychrobacter sp. Ps3 TaxID=2790957 RepID=UPI001EE0C4F4|nr:hypothetical protein [Psychrobacter sp. Ps3]MCG3881383.1 hypothetical protein [Psychrobacter sp. Ps3]